MKTNIEIPKSDFEDTLLYAINTGKEAGFTKEFEFKNKSMWLDRQSFTPDQLEISGMKRFEGMTDPGDSMIYYRITATGAEKGYFVSAYGAKANHEALDFLSRVKENLETEG